jgi:pimeloyl-ACP methyl ester carboxylesterase
MPRWRSRLATGALAALTACAPPPPPTAAPAPFRDTAPHRVLRIGVAPGVRLEVLDFGGSGPALVFLAGQSNTGHSFDTFAPRFTDQFHVYALTRRGLGGSDAPLVPRYDALTLAADIRAVLDSLGIARANLVGHSYGGTEVSWVAAGYPDRVDRIIYLDSSCNGCPDPRPGFPAPPRPPRPEAPPLTARDTLSAQAMAAYQQRTLGFSFPEADLRAITRYGDDGTVSDAVSPVIRRAIAQGAAHPGFARIRARALGIFAERATLEQEFWWSARMSRAERVRAQAWLDATLAARRAAREQFAREMPNATVAVIPGAHHFLFLSHPAETERLMRAFLAPAP